MELLFSPVHPENIEEIFAYTSVYGEGSCQHSPVAMWSLKSKYHDHFYIAEDMLYVHRSGLEDETYRYYLAPLGGGDKREAFSNIIEDAHSHGKKALFYTLTKSGADALGEYFGESFEITYSRDLSEYIIDKDTFLLFPGKKHARRRTEIRSFWRDFGDRTQSLEMTEDDLDEVLSFAERWYQAHADDDTRAALDKELHCIKRQLAHFHTLKITGTVIRVDGDIHGFCYGIPLSDECYDVLIEKGDRAFPGIYRVIRQESTRINVSDFKYVNFEEDVGEPGLRKVKESYGPAFMLDKYIAKEI